MRHLSRLALNDEGFVFDPTTGDSFQVNQTGLFLLQALRESKEDAEIARALADEYAVAWEDARQDVAEFRAQLKALGLV